MAAQLMVIFANRNPADSERILLAANDPLNRAIPYLTEISFRQIYRLDRVPADAPQFYRNAPLPSPSDKAGVCDGHSTELPS